MKRSLYLISGLIALFCGGVGVVLPLIPTTPFLLLAAFCFSKSSQRLHNWLLQHKLFGPMIMDWQSHGVIRTKVKWLATISMVLLASYPLLFVLQILWLKLTIAGCMLCVLVFIWSRPGQIRKN